MLSPAVRREISGHAYARSLRRAPFLKFVAKYDVAMDRLLLAAQTELHAPGDFIFTAGELAHKVYSLVDGRVALYQALANEGAYHSHRYIDLMDEHAFNVEVDEDAEEGHVDEDSKLDSVQLLTPPAHFGSTCLGQIECGISLRQAENLADPRHRPYSAWCRSHCEVAVLKVSDIQ